ncbi:bifunctional diguanylate cyclase/phosphodiesterase [Vibrio sp. VB16]|uniref:bifunctional diguanylate cyclase/phosphodiesterase n=1 Tax=Vibrio sp. VB16 TaxID=2785746 RepID=UPI00189ECFF0|nr:cache domain-containing protein [Vibrio sp. VB16]UGA56117.1 cache domain-containing protein [Vibrio sp. VB16]
MSSLNDNKLLRLIRFAPVVLIAIFALTINFVVIQDNRLKAQHSIDSLRDETIDRQKESIRQHIDLVVNEIHYQKTQTRKLLKQQAKNRVEEAYAIAANIYRTNQSKSKAEITKLIAEALRPIRFFEGRGYFFIFQMDGINIMHGLRPEIEGRSGWDSQDIRGTFILREHIKLVEEYGEAFYRWWYPKPGEEKAKEFEKVGFAKRFEPYNWLIGTGEYLVDVEHDVQNQVLEWLTDYGYDAQGFVFVLDNEGKILSHRDHRYIGQYLADVNESTHLDMKSMNFQTEQGGGFLRYGVPLNYGNNDTQEKISFVKGLDEWGWVIGTGFYVDDFEQYLLEKKAFLQQQNNREFLKVISLSAILTILVTLVSLLLSNMIATRFYKFQSRINSDFDELENVKNRMQHMALHDALTGLPNRLLLVENITHGIESAKKNGTDLAVIFVDLDDFKKVNDLYGHSSGDKLLEVISRKFETILGPMDTVSRFGGDEFIFCFPELSGTEQARDIIKEIKQVFDDQFVINGKIFHTNCSIGVSMFPSDSDDAESLIRKADIVLYKSKAIQKGEVMFFDSTINEQIQYDYMIEEELRRAVYKDEISVHYQPQIDVMTETLVSVEALARWSNERLGMVSPVKFIAIAESAGLIEQIGQFVFRRACEDIMSISPNGKDAIDISVNISPKQLVMPGFSTRLVEIIDDVGISIERITLEITENVLIDDVDMVTPILHHLRNLGFGISLDDFGTGYSSLSYLNSLPITEIKIDRCFVDKILVSTQSNTLIKAIIAIGQSCEVKVVAEGVETKEQYKKLVSYGCNLVQGYYVDRPLPIDKLRCREVGRVSA